MQSQVSRALSPEQLRQWCDFLAQAEHSHPEQNPRFADGWQAQGHQILFAMGWRDGELRAVAMFVAEPHPVLPGYFPVAAAFSGPVCDDPRDMADFLTSLERDAAFKHVGTLRVTPYWLAPGASGLAATLDRAGWTSFEPSYARSTGIYDLSGTADDILAQFKKNARRELRRSWDFGLTTEYVRDEATAMEAFPILQKHVENRLAEPIAEATYLEDFRNIYSTDDLGSFFVVRHEGDIIAGAMNLRSRDTFFFRRFFIDDDALPKLGKIRVAPLIQYEGMKWGQEKRCRWADENGYIHGLDPSHPLYQINKYKEAFNPTEVQRVPGHQRVLRPAICRTVDLAERATASAKTLVKALRKRLPARKQAPDRIAGRPASRPTFSANSKRGNRNASRG